MTTTIARSTNRRSYPTSEAGPRYMIDRAARADTAAALGHLLADSYMLYLKTKGFHWNVTGPRFEPLHTLFQEQYTELAEAIDELAERIRALGSKAPASFREFTSLASINEEISAPADSEMLRQLRADHMSAARAAHHVVVVAEACGDVATADLATERVTRHEKAAWMLQSFLMQ